MSPAGRDVFPWRAVPSIPPSAGLVPEELFLYDVDSQRQNAMSANGCSVRQSPNSNHLLFRLGGFNVNTCEVRDGALNDLIVGKPPTVDLLSA